MSRNESNVVGPTALIYLVRLVSYGVWGVVYPFFAVWLIGLGVFDPAVVGLIVGAGVMAQRMGSLAFVGLVERYDKRLSIVVSQMVAIVAAVGLHLLAAGPSRSVPAWMVVSVAFGLASSVATLAQITLIAEQAPAEQRKQAFAYEFIALNVAAGIAPLVSAFAIVRATGQYALVPIVFAVVTIALTMRLPNDHNQARSDTVVAESEALVQGGGGHRDLAVVLAVNFLTLVVYAQFYGVFPAYAVGDLGEDQIGLAFAASSVAIVMLQALITRLAAKSPDSNMIVLANLSMAAGTVLLLFTAGGLPLVVLAAFCIAIGEMIYSPIYLALAVRAFRSRMTLAMGAVTFTWGLAESLAILAGLALVGAGLGSLSLLAGAGIGVLVAVLAVICRRRVDSLGGPDLPAGAVGQAVEECSRVSVRNGEP